MIFEYAYVETAKLCDEHNSSDAKRFQEKLADTIGAIFDIMLHAFGRNENSTI